MSADIFDQMNQFTQQSLATWRRLGEINLALGEKLFSQQAVLTRQLAETTKASAEEWARHQRMTEAQADCARQWAEALTQSSRSYAEILDEAGAAYRQVFDAAPAAARKQAA